MLKEPRLFGAFFITFAVTSCLINKANLQGIRRTLNVFIEPCRNAGLFCVHKNKFGSLTIVYIFVEQTS